MNSITRRRLLITAGIAPITLSSLHARAVGRAPDAALVAAEQRAAAARAQQDAFCRSDDIPDELLAAEFAALDFIHETPAATLIGAAVKLRALLEEQAILDTDDAYVDSLRQALAVIERELGQAGSRQELAAGAARPNRP